jgi:hypothetical protein
MSLCLGSKPIIGMWLCADPYLAMSTTEAHQLTASGERLTMQMANVFRCFDTPHDGTSDHCGAPMSNDCQACGSAQAGVRRSIAHWSICPSTKDGGRKREGNVIDLRVIRATKSKPRGQEGTIKISGCKKLWSVCVVDSTGPASKDAREQPTGVTPRPAEKRHRRNRPYVHSMRLPKISHAEP